MRERQRSSTPVVGLGFAVVSALSFGLSGALAKGLIDAGWSPGATVTMRVVIAAAVLAGPAALQMRGRWRQARGSWRQLIAYGLVAVAACQLCYFYAIAHMDVGVALLIEYAAPVAVIVYLWLRHDERPTRVTFIGAAVAIFGLMLVLGVLSGVTVSPIGILWSLGAMAGAATYFVMSGRESHLPPLVLAAGGLTVGAISLGGACLLGVLPWQTSTADAMYAGHAVPWWVSLIALGLISGALSYVAGIAATRSLGSRLASFVALLEVVSAVAFAWILLGQQPSTTGLIGALVLLAGVVLVKIGEPRPTDLSIG